MYQKLRDFPLGCSAQRVLGEVDDCIDFGHVTLQCPADSFFPNRLATPIDGRVPLLRCKVCGLGVIGADRDRRRGLWAGTVTWGPNRFERGVSETSVQLYRLYVVDDALRKLGQPLASTEAKLWATSLMPGASACDERYYQAEVAFAVPAGAAAFMVVPVTRGGLELNVGPTLPLEDIGAAGADGAVRSGGAAPLVAIAVIVRSLIALL